MVLTRILSRSKIARNIKSISCNILYTRKLSSTNSIVERKGSYDISGHIIDMTDQESVELYNEIINNFLTHENDPAPGLRELLKKNFNNSMVNTLLAIQLIRNPRPCDKNENAEVEDCLITLEASLIAGKHIRMSHIYIFI